MEFEGSGVATSLVLLESEDSRMRFEDDDSDEGEREDDEEESDDGETDAVDSAGAVL